MAVRILGLDPGLRHTGWGVIEADGYRLRSVADGVVHTEASDALAVRLACLFEGLCRVVAQWSPEEAAVEETFVNRNPLSTLKLGQARGVSLLVPASAGISVAEYAPRQIKKAVVGTGGASKEQVQVMVRTLLPGCQIATSDAADALAVAVCHAHMRGSTGAMFTARLQGTQT